KRLIQPRGRPRKLDRQRSRRRGRSRRCCGIRFRCRHADARGGRAAGRTSRHLARGSGRQDAAHRQRAARHRTRGDRMTTIADEAILVPTEPAIEELSLRERRGQVLLGTITAAHFSHHVANSLLNPLLPLIRDAFALSYGESGFAVSAFSIAAGLANAPWGMLA